MKWIIEIESDRTLINLTPSEAYDVLSFATPYKCDNLTADGGLIEEIRSWKESEPCGCGRSAATVEEIDGWCDKFDEILSRYTPAEKQVTGNKFLGTIMFDTAQERMVGMAEIAWVMEQFKRGELIQKQEPLEELAKRKGKDLRLDIAFSNSDYFMSFLECREYLNGLPDKKGE